MEIPVFLITGFLESGKTLFMNDTLSDTGFSNGKKTLLLLCEEGTEEYDEEWLAKVNTLVVPVESEENLTEEFLFECNKKYKPERVIIEYNGMWRLEKLYKMKLPRRWEIVQVITTVCASTFSLYLNNMRSQVMEQFANADMVIFNRCLPDTPKASYRRNVKAINPSCEVYFENADGSPVQPDESLPYDLDAPVIEIEDEDYGIFYVDIMDAPEKYEGKTVSFTAMVYKSERLPKNVFVPGRFAMTCCADDIAFIGIPCMADVILVNRLKKKQWIHIEAVIKCEYDSREQRTVPVMTAKSVEEGTAPKEETVYFN